MNATAYIRVSTSTQDMEHQRHELTEYAATMGMVVTRWIEADGISSRKSYAERRIDAVLKLRKGDTLLVSELSRLARSTRQALEVVEELGKRGVVTYVKKQGLRLNGADDIATKATVTALSLAADIERTMTSDRTRAALSRIKSEGKALGMAAKSPEAADAIRAKASASITAKATAQAEILRNTFQNMTARGLTQRSMVEELNRLGTPTPRGGEWSQATVCRMLKRLA